MTPDPDAVLSRVRRDVAAANAGHAVDSSDHRERVSPQLSALDAAMEATSGGEEWESSWEAAAEGSMYRRGLILSSALQAAEPAIKADAEAKLAAIEALCRRRAEEVRAEYPGVGMPAVPVSAASILAIIGSEEG